jgi:hypothetical protein
MCNRYGYLAPVSRLVDKFSEVKIPVRPWGRVQKLTDLDRFRDALHGGDLVVDDRHRRAWSRIRDMDMSL